MGRSLDNLSLRMQQDINNRTTNNMIDGDAQHQCRWLKAPPIMAEMTASAALSTPIQARLVTADGVSVLYKAPAPPLISSTTTTLAEPDEDITCCLKSSAVNSRHPVEDKDFEEDDFNAFIVSTATLSSMETPAVIADTIQDDVASMQLEYNSSCSPVSPMQRHSETSSASLPVSW